jgi:hypothetical protein
MPSGYIGKITCPSDIPRFCKTAYNCPNLCSRHGFCVNGVCICMAGYSGTDCSTAAPICAAGSYTNGGTCATCSSGCLSCTGPAGTQCTSCYYTHYNNGSGCLACNAACYGCTGPAAN